MPQVRGILSQMCVCRGANRFIDAVAQDGNGNASPEAYRGTARRSSTGPAGPSKKKTNVYDDDDDDRGYEGEGIVGDEDEYE